MKKMKILFILGAILAVLIAAFAIGLSPRVRKPAYSQSGNIVREIKIGGNKIMAEIVANPEKRALGLSGRDGSCPDCGMLFVFEKPGEYSFWMKDMRFDLDIVWISNGEITGIEKNISHTGGSSTVVRPNVPVNDVLEVNAGTSDKLKLKEGDKLSF